MNKHFEKQLEGFKGDHCMLLYFVEQNGGLFTERTVHDIGKPIVLEKYKFVRMHNDVLPVFTPI